MQASGTGAAKALGVAIVRADKTGLAAAATSAAIAVTAPNPDLAEEVSCRRRKDGRGRLEREAAAGLKAPHVHGKAQRRREGV